MRVLAASVTALLSFNAVAGGNTINGLDFGPIAKLVGVWQGDKGADLAPGQNGPAVAPYFETIDIKVVGDVTNASAQTLSVLSYHQEVFRKEDGNKFHDQIGYWIYDPSTQEVHHTISIPRAVTVVATGKADSNGAIEVTTDSQIAQSQFMQDNANTKQFDMKVMVDGNTLSYQMTTHLDIYDKPFAHTDSNQLTRK